MHTLFIAATILFTSVSAVSLGIAAGYAAIWAILNAFGRQPGPEPVTVSVDVSTQTLTASR